MPQIGQQQSDDFATLTNYSTRNPVIRFLLSNFLNHVDQLLKDIHACRLFGLDAGCGEGHLLSYLYKQNTLARMVAVDLDNRKLNYARKYFPYCEYQNANAQMLPFADNTFDFILSTEVFEHLPKPQAALYEIRRVAKPGAHLVISVPFEPFFHWGNLVRGLYWDRGGRTPDHLNFWQPYEFRRFLSDNVIISRQYCIRTFPWLLLRCRFK